jgi:hypothetical protein
MTLVDNNPAARCTRSDIVIVFWVTRVSPQWVKTIRKNRNVAANPQAQAPIEMTNVSGSSRAQSI